MALTNLEDISKTGTETGGSLADKINVAWGYMRTMDTQVIDNLSYINNVISRVTQIEDTAIPDLQSQIDAINAPVLKGIAGYGLSTSTDYAVGTTLQKFGFVDTISVDDTQGDFTLSFVDNEIQVSKAGNYTVDLDMAIAGAANSEFTFSIFKNGVSVRGIDPVVITGGVSEPIGARVSCFLSVNTGDVVDIRAKADTAQTLTVGFSCLRVERK